MITNADDFMAAVAEAERDGKSFEPERISQWSLLVGYWLLQGDDKESRAEPNQADKNDD